MTSEKDVPNTILALPRHAGRGTVYCVAAVDGNVAGALRDAAERFAADMIVMGSFVHARLREIVLGGVMQSLLRKSHVPLFMSY